MSTSLVSAWLVIGSESDESTRIQRQFFADAAPDFLSGGLRSNLATSIGFAVFGITGDESTLEKVSQAARDGRNVVVGIGGGLTATVMPCYPETGFNLSHEDPTEL